jgi:penicillin G amidase
VGLVGQVLVVLVIAVAVGVFRHVHYGDLTFRREIDMRPLGHVSVSRENDGAVAVVKATSASAALFGLGYVHAYDRLVQMVMLRTVVQGRLSELLANNEKTQQIDVVMRSLGVYQRAVETEATMVEVRRSLYAQLHNYVDGVNRVLKDERLPFEFWLAGLQPELWTMADTLATLNIMCLLDLADVQGVVELFALQADRDGVSRDAVAALFPPAAALDDETRAAIRELVLDKPFLPDVLHFLPAKGLGSNNWAIAPSRSASGKAQLVNDPHLQTSRLPAIWYEVKLELPNAHVVFGCTMPGVPGVVMGRNRNVAFGFTYGFADQHDFVLERVKSGRYERENGRQVPLERHLEVIKRKGGDNLYVQVVATSAGPLDIKPMVGTDMNEMAKAKLADGTYLARATHFDKPGLIRTIEALAGALSASVKTADDVRRTFGPIILSSNIIAADINGDIVYQQTAQVRKRADGWNGFVPWLGWRGEPYDDGELDWRNYTSVTNPACGFLATANNDVRADLLGAAAASTPIVNTHMGSHRVARISELLGQSAQHDERSALALLADTRVNFAPPFLDVLRDTLAKRTDEPSRLLREWDVRAQADSKGCTVFHRIYDAVHTEAFSRVLGASAWRHLRYDTPVFVDFSYSFDRVLMDTTVIYKSTQERDADIRRIAASVLDALAGAEILPWGVEKQYVMKNIFFADMNLPAWLGFDSAPVAAPGASGTVVQSATFRSHGRDSNWQQSWRFFTDMAHDVALTTMPGGPSGNRFSALYQSNTHAWSERQFKRVKL